MSTFVEKHVLLISRQFKPGAPIKIDVTSAEIKIAMPLETFLEQLAEEIGSPAGIFRKKGLAAALKESAEVVCEKMKGETVRVM